MVSLLSRAALGAVLSGALLVASVAPASAECTIPPLDRQALQAAIDDLDHPAATAAQIRVSGSAGRWYGTSGVSDRTSGAPVRPDQKFRAGSITKVFVATVVLQLAGERRIDLDTSIRRYLPGLHLPDDYEPVTVLHLLNHTSGLPDGSGPDLPDMSTPEKVLAHRYDQWTPERIVATVTRTETLKFTPGTAQEYRGINYVLAAMLIEKITGRPYADEIGARILRPLGLRDTVFPGDDPRIHGSYVHGYLRMSDCEIRDISEFNQSVARGEGDIISTTGDLDRFITGLFSGRLLRPALLDKMFVLPKVDMWHEPGSPSAGPARYGAGLQTYTVNGIELWGKTGERYGYNSGMFATRDQQRRATYSFTPLRRDASQQEMTLRIANAATKPAA